MIAAPKELSTLNFMRALSTLVVVGIHYGGLSGHFQNGLGALPRVVVLMFFVHTGFVLMLTLERQHAAGAGHLWRRFMVRRFFRVYPLALVVLAAIIGFRIPSTIVPPVFQYLDSSGADLLSNLLLTMNLTCSPTLLSPMWSLPYEFQLYLLLPASFLLVNRWRGPLPGLGLSTGLSLGLSAGLSRWLSLVPSVGLWCVAVLLALLQPRVPQAGRFDILEYAPCMTAGVLCYSLSRVVRPRLPFAVWVILLAALMSLCLLSPNPSNWPAAWVTCLLTASTAPFIRETSHALVRGVSHWISQHSYAIYLTHYFCLWAAFRANHFCAPGQWAIFIAAIVLLPAALYRWIEAPMIRVGRALTGGDEPAVTALHARTS